MAGRARGYDFNYPVRRSGTSAVRQLFRVADYADIRLHYGFVVIFKQFDGKGGRVDFAIPIFGADITTDSQKQEAQYFLMYPAGGCYIIKLPIDQFRPHIFR